MNRNTDRTEVVTEHAHTHRNASDTLTRFMVQREIVGRGRFRRCWLAQKVIVTLTFGKCGQHNTRLINADLEECFEYPTSQLRGRGHGHSHGHGHGHGRGHGHGHGHGHLIQVAMPTASWGNGHNHNHGHGNGIFIFSKRPQSRPISHTLD